MDAIEYFKGMRKILCEEHLKIFPKNTIGYQASLLEKSFYDAAIKALEQQTCTDAISRSEAIRVASGYCHFTNIPDELAKLPSVNPKPCEDIISRQAVLMELDKYLCGVPFDEKGIDEVIKELPSVCVKQETPIDCSDSICRADAIKLVKSYIHEIITESGIDKNSHTNEILRDIVKVLAFELPSVSTEKTDAYKQGWHDAIITALKETHSVHMEEVNFRREEKLKLLLDTGEYDFIKYIPKENMWKLIFALAYIEDTVPMSDIDGIKEEIKTKISDYEGCSDFNEGIRFGLRTALEIIDRYKGESEDKK